MELSPEDLCLEPLDSIDPFIQINILGMLEILLELIEKRGTLDPISDLNSDFEILLFLRDKIYHFLINSDFNEMNLDEFNGLIDQFLAEKNLNLNEIDFYLKYAFSNGQKFNRESILYGLGILTERIKYLERILKAFESITRITIYHFINLRYKNFKRLIVE